jgi:capsular polysaccharide export protein
VYGVFNRGLKRLPYLASFLGGEVVCCFWTAPANLTAVVGWGRRKFGRRARRIAEKCTLPFVCLEDGFLRSVGLGSSDPPLSVVVDDLGIYYDADYPSRLETLISQSRTAAEMERARALLTDWRRGRVSKYNHTREFTGTLPPRYVLVVDQTFGDAAIRHGRADQASFQRMLAAALTEHPTVIVLLKVHPEVLAGRKRGHFDLAAVGKNPRVQVLAEDVHPVALIEQAEAIYTVTSQVGFEGLLWGKPVRTFGMPFYAGWG